MEWQGNGRTGWWIRARGLLVQAAEHGINGASIWWIRRAGSNEDIARGRMEPGETLGAAKGKALEVAVQIADDDAAAWRRLMECGR